MMRLLCVAALSIILASCQSVDSVPADNDELTPLVVFHQTLNQLSDAELARAADQARDVLRQGVEAPVDARLRLLLLEAEIELRELRQIHEAQLKQIEALNSQIEALTAIEQQINRRGQLQETDNE